MHHSSLHTHSPTGLGCLTPFSPRRNVPHSRTTTVPLYQPMRYATLHIDLTALSVQDVGLPSSADAQPRWPLCSTCPTVGGPCTTTCCGPTGVQSNWQDPPSLATASAATMKGRSHSRLTPAQLLSQDLVFHRTTQLHLEAPYIHHVSSEHIHVNACSNIACKCLSFTVIR